MSPEVSPENLAGGWHGVLRRGPAHQAVNLAGHRLFRLFWAQYDSIETGALRDPQKVMDVKRVQRVVLSPAREVDSIETGALRDPQKVMDVQECVQRVMSDQ